MTMCKCGQDARFSHACLCTGLSSAVGPIFVASAPASVESAEVIALRAEVERLTRERDGWQRAAESQNQQWSAKCEEVTEATARAEAAEAREAEARAVLREIEWFGFGFCPVCSGERPQGHFPQCSLASVLGRITGGEEG